MDLHQKSPLLWILSVPTGTVLSECGPATGKKLCSNKSKTGWFALFERHVLFKLVAPLIDELFNPFNCEFPL